MTTQTFESALSKFEKIVEALESGGLPLEKSLKKFEEGVALSRFCHQKLEEIETTVNRLIEDARGNTTEEPFGGDMGVDDV